jgi:hypothetical protein
MKNASEAGNGNGNSRAGRWRRIKSAAHAVGSATSKGHLRREALRGVTIVIESFEIRETADTNLGADVLLTCIIYVFLSGSPARPPLLNTSYELTLTTASGGFDHSFHNVALAYVARVRVQNMNIKSGVKNIACSPSSTCLVQQGRIQPASSRACLSPSSFSLLLSFSVHPPSPLTITSLNMAR